MDEVVADLTVDQPRGVAQQILHDHRPVLRLEPQRPFPPTIGCSTPTLRSSNSGRYCATGARRSSLPSSTSIMAATETIGLVIEARRKIASVFHRHLLFAVLEPDRLQVGDFVAAAISNTAPGNSPRST